MIVLDKSQGIVRIITVLVDNMNVKCANFHGNPSNFPRVFSVVFYLNC